MLIEFTVGNFLSFGENRTISFQAGSISELPDNVVKIRKQKLLKSGVIYGANSSGKSNLIKAMQRMRNMVLSSVKLNDTDELEFTPFLLSDKENPLTHFEVLFEFSKSNYRYGFEYNTQIISSEWLFVQNSNTEYPLFYRTEDGIKVYDKFSEGISKEESTNDNRLFLSLVAQLGGSLSKQLINWFRHFNIISGIDHSSYGGYSIKMLNERLEGCNESLEFFQRLKLGFKELTIKESEFDDKDIIKFQSVLTDKARSNFIKNMKDSKLFSLMSIHNKYNKNGKITGQSIFDTDSQESEGTKKIIDLSGPIFDTLLNGKILVVDELDAKLHPLITIEIIKLFNSPVSNPNNAQLFFATHDTHLLDADLFRRDQIWFAEKDEQEQTDIYSLIEFKLPDGSKVRNDSNLEKNYIRGRYGAIPFMIN